MPIVMLNMTHMFPPGQLERIVPVTHFFLAEVLTERGYAASEAEQEIGVPNKALDHAIRRPRSALSGAGRAALQRFAERSGGRLVFLADVRTTQHAADGSRSIATFLSLLAAAGGTYGVPVAERTANSRWALIDPATGEVLRAFEESLREKAARVARTGGFAGICPTRPDRYRRRPG